MLLNSIGNRNLINNDNDNKSEDELQELMSQALDAYQEETPDELQANNGELMQGIMSGINLTENNNSPCTPGQPMWAYAEADNKPCPIMRASNKGGRSFWDYEI